MFEFTKRRLFNILKLEYIDRGYKVKAEEIVKFMDKNYKQFKAYSGYETFYLCKRSNNEFFIADSTETLKEIILKELEETGGNESEIKVLRRYQ